MLKKILRPPRRKYEGSYTEFSRFFDEVMLDYSWCVPFIKKQIRQRRPRARTVLELACGSGNILRRLPPKYVRSGVDLSRPMLARARKKLPGVKLFHADMSSFTAPEPADVLLCIFDSINHLPGWAQWKALFRRTRQNLKEDGLSILDINPPERLDRYAAFPPALEEYKKDVFVVKVRKLKPARYNFLLQLFRYKSATEYILHEENVRECAFPVPAVIRELKKYFPVVDPYDHQGRRILTAAGWARAKKERIFFVCERRPHAR